MLRPVSAAACQTRKKSVDFALSTEKARACTQTYITADDDRKKGVRHALISRLVEMTGPLVYTVMPVSGDNGFGECSFGKGVCSLVRFSTSENLCTRRVLRPVSVAACQTRKKSVDFALSTEKARACTQTYITADDDRKKGVIHALISRLVESLPKWSNPN